MVKQEVRVFFKGGKYVLARNFDAPVGSIFEFTLKLNGHDVDFAYVNGKWMERDYQKEERMGEVGFYKETAMDFDRVEFKTIFKGEE